MELIENKDYTKEIIRFLLFFFAGVMLNYRACRNPRLGTKVETVKQTGIDVFFLLDVSNSMAA